MQDSHTQGIKWKNAWNAIIDLKCTEDFKRKLTEKFVLEQYFSIYRKHVFASGHLWFLFFPNMNEADVRN